jgi:hypothetical protein
MLPARYRRPPCRTIAPLTLAIAGALLSVALPAAAQEKAKKAFEKAQRIDPRCLATVLALVELLVTARMTLSYRVHTRTNA